MKFRVRTEDGELEFKSFGQVEEAWLLGLVGPDDELLEEGKTKWRKASTFPLLMKARRSGEKVWVGTWFGWTLLGVIGATIALVLINKDDWESRVGGLVVAFVVAIVMVRVHLRAHARSKPHH